MKTNTITKHYTYDNAAIKSNPFTALVFFTGSEVHNHAFWEFAYVINGDCYHFFQNTAKNLTRGAAVLCRPLKDTHILTSNGNSKYAHRDIYISDEKFKRLCDTISDTLYEELLSEPLPPSFYISSSHINSLESNLSLIDSAYKNTDAHGYIHYRNAALIDSIHSCAIVQLLSYYLTNKIRDILKYPNWLTDLLNNLSDLNFLTSPIEDIAKTTEYSHGHLCREFKKYLHIPLKQYISQLKLDYASKMILQTNEPLIDIAYRFNYSTQSSFIKAFKNYFGKSPLQWKHEKLQQMKASATMNEDPSKQE